VTVKCEKQIGDEAGEDLSHEGMFGPCELVIKVEMPFPPSEEGFDIPSEEIDFGDLLGGKVETVGGDPEGFGVGAVPDQAEGLPGKCRFGGAEEDDGVIEDHAAGYEWVLGENGFGGVLADAADEVNSL